MVAHHIIINDKNSFFAWRKYAIFNMIKILSTIFKNMLDLLTLDIRPWKNSSGSSEDPVKPMVRPHCLDSIQAGTTRTLANDFSFLSGITMLSCFHRLSIRNKNRCWVDILTL